MWDFSDPVVFWAVFTVSFGVSMLVVIYFWIRHQITHSEIQRNRGNAT